MRGLLEDYNPGRGSLMEQVFVQLLGSQGAAKKGGQLAARNGWHTCSGVCSSMISLKNLGTAHPHIEASTLECKARILQDGGQMLST